MLFIKQGFILAVVVFYVFNSSSGYSQDEHIIDLNQNKNLQEVPTLKLGDLNISNSSSTLISPIKLEARIDVPLELNLEKAINIALQQNLDIAYAKSKKDIDKWRFIENIGNWLPDYKTGLSAQRFDGQFLVGGVFPVMTLTSSVNAFMRFDYRFFEGGKGLFNTIAANKLYKSSIEDLSASMKQIMMDVAKSYFNLLKEQAKLDVLVKAVEEAQSELELNKNLESQGVGTRFDVLQAEAQLAEQEQEYITQQSTLREASINLAQILNFEQGTHIKSDVNDLTIRKLYDLDHPIAEILSVAFKNRPEIKKVQYELSAQKKYVGAAFSTFLPRANFFGQYGGTGNAFFHRTKIREIIPDAIALDENGNPVVQHVSRSRNYRTFFDPETGLSDITSVSNVVRGAGQPFLTKLDDSLMASKFIGIQIDWDIGDGLGVPTISRINQARKQVELSKITLDKLNQKVEQDVRTAFLRAQTSEKLIEVANKRVNAATEALKLAKVRLENGVGINTELLSSQKQYAGSLSSQVDAIVEYNKSQIELLYSLGLISPESILSR